MAWKLFFSTGLETFHMAQKLSTWPGKCPYGLESFQILWTVLCNLSWKVSWWSEKFSLKLASFHIAKALFLMFLQIFPEKKYELQKLSRFAKTFQVALLPCYLGFPPWTVDECSTYTQHNIVCFRRAGRVKDCKKASDLSTVSKIQWSSSEWEINAEACKSCWCACRWCVWWVIRARCMVGWWRKLSCQGGVGSLPTLSKSFDIPATWIWSHVTFNLSLLSCHF